MLLKTQTHFCLTPEQTKIFQTARHFLHSSAAYLCLCVDLSSRFFFFFFFYSLTSCYTIIKIIVKRPFFPPIFFVLLLLRFRPEWLRVECRCRCCLCKLPVLKRFLLLLLLLLFVLPAQLTTSLLQNCPFSSLSLLSLLLCTFTYVRTYIFFLFPPFIHSQCVTSSFF